MIVKKYCFLTVLIAITGTTTPHTPTTKPENAFRDFEHNAPEHVKQFYRENHTNQTLAFILEKKADYSRLNKAEMSILDAFKALDTLVDQSDVDIALPQIYHAFQTAEAIRQDGHPDWLILTGLIHDLGKVLTLFDEPQWAIVGDTFPAGCAYANKVVFSDYFVHNPDYSNPAYQTKYGIYTPHCGLRNLHMSWGHDEYLYLVMKDYLPHEALYIIRFHSFYAHHKERAYDHLMDTYDEQMLPWLQLFSRYDLYSKANSEVDFQSLMPYYKNLIDTYIPQLLRW